MLGGEGVDELLELGCGDLDGAAAGAAHEVVVVLAAGLAAQVGVLAGGLELDLEVALLGHRVERAVHRREADLLAALLQELVDLLRAAELGDLVEQLRDRHALTRDPLADHTTTSRPLAFSTSNGS